MRYDANFHINLRNASASRDMQLQRDMLLDEISYLIDTYPQAVASALRSSGIAVKDGTNKQELIDKTAKGLAENKLFRWNISTVIAYLNSGQLEAAVKNRPDYANQEGEGSWWDNLFKSIQKTGGGAASGGAQGGAGGAIVGAVAGAVDSVFGWMKSKKDAEAEETKAKAAMYERIFGQKKSALPIVIIGGTLLIGGLVLFLILRKK